MNFSRERKGYNCREVDAYIIALENTASDLRLRIEELKKEAAALKKENEAGKEKCELINKAIYNAVAKAEQVEKLAKLHYEQDMRQLKAFHDKWMAYYQRILYKYPLDDELKEITDFNERMTLVLNNRGSEELEAFKREEDLRLQKNAAAPPKFDPVERIKSYLDGDGGETAAASSDAGFSFEEALNPKEDLTSIMRELGFDVEEG